MHTLDAVEAASLRSDVPDFRPGDTVKVHVRVVEGNRSRIQVFQGVVIAAPGVRGSGELHRAQGLLRRGRGAHVPRALAGRREDRGGLRGDVRRAKLYYLRSRRGKAAKIREKRES
jgi:large subunit ribosomal protein L19